MSVVVMVGTAVMGIVGIRVSMGVVGTRVTRVIRVVMAATGTVTVTAVAVCPVVCRGVGRHIHLGCRILLVTVRGAHPRASVSVGAG